MNQKDLDSIKNKLDNRPVDIDKSALWNELETRLPKKRNRKSLFFLFFSIGLIITIVGLGSMGDQTFDNNEVSALKEDFLAVTKIPKNTPQENISLQTNDQKHTASNNSNLEKEKLLISPSSITTSKDTNIEEIRRFDNIKTDPSQLAANNLSSSRSTNSSNPNSLSAKTIVENTPELAFTYSNSSSSSSSSSSISRFINSARGENIPKPDTHIFSNTNSENSLEIEKTYLSDFHSIYSLGISIKTLNSQILLPTLEPSKQIVSNSILPKRWTLDFTLGGMYLNNFMSLNPHGSNQEYITSIQKNTRIRPGYMMDIGLRITNTKGWSLGLSGNRSSMFETFTYQSMTEKTETLFNDQAFILEGNYIGASQEISKITNRKVLHQNEYRIYNLSPSIGYQWNSWANFLVHGGFNYTISNSYNGKLLTRGGEITNDLAALFPKRNTGITGYFMEGSIFKPIANRIQASLHLRYQKTNNLHDNSKTEYSTQLSSLGIGIGFNYRLY